MFCLNCDRLLFINLEPFENGSGSKLAWKPRMAVRCSWPLLPKQSSEITLDLLYWGQPTRFSAGFVAKKGQGKIVLHMPLNRLPFPHTTHTNTYRVFRSPGRAYTDSLHHIHFLLFHWGYALGHLQTRLSTGVKKISRTLVWNADTPRQSLWEKIQYIQHPHIYSQWHPTRYGQWSPSATFSHRHGCTTTSAIEVSMLHAHMCGTVYPCTCDETWTLRVSSVNWKHFYLGVSQPRRIVTVCCFVP